MQTTAERPAAAGIIYNRGAEIRAAVLAAFHDFVHVEPIGSAPFARDEWRRCAVNLHALQATREHILKTQLDPVERMRLIGPTLNAIAGEHQALANFRLSGRWA